MKASVKKIFGVFCATTFVLSAFSFIGCTPAPTVEAENVKNVILFIGDGMGENHIENTLTYFELDEPVFFKDRRGSIATHSANSPITDSAAAATALATGNKVNNREISYHNGENLSSISELALAAGKKVGVITTDTLDGATPACFSSHAKDRSDSADIAKGQATSGIQLLIGETGSGAYDAYAPYFAENGYAVATDPEEMLALADSEKLIATLPAVRSSYSAGHENDYQLKDMAAFAIDFLDNENGYFLMIESAHVDKFSHDNDLIPALCETRSLFDCMRFLYDTIGQDTALILTADHETGRLEKASSKSELTNNLYNTGAHTSRHVPLFVKNFSYTCNGTPQNTEIFKICKQLLNIA